MEIRDCRSVVLPSRAQLLAAESRGSAYSVAQSDAIQVTISDSSAESRLSVTNTAPRAGPTYFRAFLEIACKGLTPAMTAPTNGSATTHRRGCSQLLVCQQGSLGELSDFLL